MIPKKIIERLEIRNVFLAKEPVPRCAGAHLPCWPWGGRGRPIYEFEANLFYRVNSSTARAIQKYPVMKNQKTKKQTSSQNSLCLCLMGTCVKEVCHHAWLLFNHFT